MRGLYRLLSQATCFSLALTAPSPISSITTKSLVTTDGYSYVYDHVAPHNASMPTLLLIHGYPASRYHWHHQIPALSEAGYGIIAPDCLGYGDTSKPTAIEAYNLKDMAGHMAQILDAEGLRDVVGVGHDWGSFILGRSAVYHPKRFSKLVFVSVGYLAPGTLFDIDGINEQGLKNLGYTPFGYWYFFNSYDIAGIVSQKLESFYHLLFLTNSSTGPTEFSQISAARSWLAANKTTELPAWLSPEDKATWLRQYSQPNTVVATLNYYKALLRGVDVADEAALMDEDRTLKVPVLGIAGTEDGVTLPDALRPITEPWSKAGYEERPVQAGHWMMLEKPDEFNQILIDFAHPTKRSK
ncbi:alpha/beta-hydrolase [Xylariaceae sp. AK1471]|nr:alpha/beta-hydrolase [Xylariaceae sp. AK1471]